MKNKLLAVILALCMVLPLLPLVGVLSAAEQGILYYDENGEAQYYNGPLGSTNSNRWGTEHETTWIYINQNMTINHTIQANGHVNLIIANGVTLDLGDRSNTGLISTLEVASYHGRSLTIYAQSKDKNTAGTVKGQALGSEQYRGIGDLTINGGNIEFGPSPLGHCAGIGIYASTPQDGRNYGGSVTINGGFVKAKGTNLSAGIGGGWGTCVKTININGGDVEAYGGYGAPGIGTGYKSLSFYESCTININGGTIRAYGGEGAPGIGAGFNSNSLCTVNINGGDITAVANCTTNLPNLEYDNKIYGTMITELEGGAGIGAAAFTQAKTIVNISGGNITASSVNGAGIGSSEVNNAEVDVNISGGTINATSVNGAGIGAGSRQRDTRNVTVNITGGEITAQSTAGKGIGDGAETNETTVRIAGTDIVHHSVTASSYNDNTVIEGDYKDAALPGVTKILSPSAAAGKTIRPILYCYEFGNPQGPFLEMAGSERKDLAEYLSEAFLPYIGDNVIYVVKEDLTIEHLMVVGTAVLYLCKDATLTVRNGIYVINDELNGVNEDGNLIIVAQAEDSGKLICGPTNSGAAIGSYYDRNDQHAYNTGLIRVYSGTVEAIGAAGFPAIGGNNVTFSQYGGVVKATGGEGAPGIGLFAGDTTGSASIELLSGRLIARGGTTDQPMGLGGANASISVSWRFDTDAYDLDPCVGTVTIASGKEFKYLNTSPVQTAVASDFATGGVFVPHTSTYYVDVNGDVQRVNDFIELSNNGNASGSISTVDGGWYVCVNDARNPLQIREIQVNGTMNLILTDGTELRPDSFVVNPGATLNIYGQLDGTGVLRTTNFSDGESGIGGNIINSGCGTVNIYGGKIIAKGTKYASAIGGAGLSGAGGTINIYGGDVKATPGTDDSHGLGNGWNQSGAVINYYGGRIDAGSVSGTLNFHNYFLYEDDGSRVYEDEYDPSRVIVPGLPEAAEYIDENGEEQSTYAYKRLHTDAATLSGTYYVYEDATFTARPHVSGTVTLILKDGVTLTAEKGIGVNAGSTLKIYAQCRNEEETGALTALDPGIYYAGIGGDGNGAGANDSAVGAGDILIAGGKITATGGLSAAAIGAGGANTYYPLPGGTVTITDGFVTANGQNGPAIGSGSNTVSGTVNISGGVVTANNQGYAAAIGAGTLDDRNKSLADYTVNISGGIITAKANGYMSGTNIGYAGSGMEINITGGQIDASYAGSWSASGIGYTGNVVRISANDPALSVKYSMIKGSEITIGEGLCYSDGSAITTPPEDNKTIVVYLSHIALVTFDPDNGGDTTSVNVIIGSKTTAPADPEAPEGYHFIGWYDDEIDSERAFDFEEDLITGDVTLTAHYAKNVYTVTYDPDNGEDVVTRQVEHGDCAPIMYFTKPHAILSGWLKDGANYNMKTPVTSDLTLTAYWLYEQVRVNIRNMDGSGDGFTSVNYGECVQLNENHLSLTHPESLFLGWREAGSSTLFDLNTPITEEKTLYAVMAYGRGGRSTATAGSYGNYNEGYANLLDQNVSTKWCISGFDGSYIEFSTAEYILPIGYILTTGNDTDVNPSRNPTAWKIYGKNSVTDSWTLLWEVTGNDKLGATSCTPYVFPLTTNTAYRFFRVEFNAIGVENDGVFQLSEFAFMTETVTEIPTVTVNYDPGEGSGSIESDSALKGDAIVLPYGDDLTPPAGKVFSGWSYDGTTYDEGDEFVVSGDGTNITLTAVYEDSVTVTFVNGGETTEAFAFVAGEEVVLPGNVFNFTAPAGKVFDGWSANGVVYHENDGYTVNASVVFTAVWKDASPWDLLQAQFDALGEGDSLSITLTGDMVAPVGSEPLYIPEGAFVTLDLCGYKIDRALTVADSDGEVFSVDGTLTVNDSSVGQTGMITGGFNTENGGEGGGVYVSSTGTFILNGGSITGNKADYGGGVEIYGTFVMTGGSITGNIALINGGGVEMYGDYCLVTLSGSAKIYGNVLAYYDEDEDEFVTSSDNDVGLYGGQFLTIDGAFTSGARIGVNAPEYNVFTDGLNGARVFFSNVEDYTVLINEDGEAYIGEATALPGDINLDGTVDITDVTALLNVLAGGTAAGECDLSGDGNVDITDVTALLNLLS